MAVTGRDIVVVGASAGGFQALKQLTAGLPPSLNATMFVAVHSSPIAPGLLPELLQKAGPLRAAYAVDGERFQRGRIYVAPPNHHLLIANEHVQVTLGPRENNFRPAVDPLFRTAAHQHGPRVVGIVLSGALDDGTRGLQEIKRQGGIAIAQHIEEATIPQMPLSAIQNVEVDYILRAAEMPAVITRLASEARTDGMKRRRGKTKKSDIARRGTRALEIGVPPGTPSPFTCAECGGTLWEQKDGKVNSFRCHVGHAFTGEALGAGLDDRVEMAMWTALRTLEETVALQRRLAERARDNGLTALAHNHEKRARTARERAQSLQMVLTNGHATARRAPQPLTRRHASVKTARKVGRGSSEKR